MRRFSLMLLTSAAVVLSLVSCGRKDKVIPRGKMARIYAEMFVLDQKIYSDIRTRDMADTLMVYEPVFREYGYTSDDYRASMEYYIKDPDRYARILRESTVILETRLKELRKEKALLESISRSKSASEAYRPERIFYFSGLANKDLLTVDSLSFYVDSTGTGSYMFDVQKGYDTLFVGPAIVVAGTASREQVQDSLREDSTAGRKVIQEREPGIVRKTLDMVRTQDVKLKTSAIGVE